MTKMAMTNKRSETVPLLVLYASQPRFCSSCSPEYSLQQFSQDMDVRK
jgi:hypothetical protein